ncbi:enoyl-ACP reductase FabI [Enterobacteriaceae endosymbiont of Neohaemonia nigricornis]|uniref:enoyl-ACP reductase FabI n=1 Tax=Enterobacteriaceae endosymbiont of Neohaemonia nigricornis TaxID=2675792 RepID=UPI001448C3BB|nr:SDR family oxidoreductase [Enterobacteriaceae endosymbiont of Neohaemonia nigricornis]QJC30273.1 SDR family oxidoreductase [Enterobacteriaceae endosymbiont of Neohaemonia nigricornis]
MSLLLGKKILITGIYNKYSIAYGIAQIMFKHKAELIITYQKEKYKNKILSLVKHMTNNPIFKCDFSQDEDIKKLFRNITKIWTNFDGFVHSIAFMPFYKINNNFIQNISRNNFNITHEISSYSLLGMIKECINILNEHSSIVVLSYLGAQRVVSNYHIMGSAKASLEANIRYMACYLGKKNIRINCISSAPIKTVSSMAIKDFNKIKKYYKKKSPLSYPITIYHIGNVAVFLTSYLSDGITGEIIHVDGGFNLIAL